MGALPTLRAATDPAARGRPVLRAARLLRGTRPSGPRVVVGCLPERSGCAAALGHVGGADRGPSLTAGGRERRVAESTAACDTPPQSNVPPTTREQAVPLEPGPMQVIHNAFSTKGRGVRGPETPRPLADHLRIRADAELPLHWHDVDNCGYVLEGSSYVLNAQGERFPARSRGQAGDPGRGDPCRGRGDRAHGLYRRHLGASELAREAVITQTRGQSVVRGRQAERRTGATSRLEGQGMGKVSRIRAEPIRLDLHGGLRGGHLPGRGARLRLRAHPLEPARAARPVHGSWPWPPGERRASGWVSCSTTRCCTTPAASASSIATLDEISDGRAILTYGVGDTAVRWLGLRPAKVAELEEATVLARTACSRGRRSMWERFDPPACNTRDPRRSGSRREAQGHSRWLGAWRTASFCAWGGTLRTCAPPSRAFMQERGQPVATPTRLASGSSSTRS